MEGPLSSYQIKLFEFHLVVECTLEACPTETCGGETISCDNTCDGGIFGNAGCPIDQATNYATCPSVSPCGKSYVLKSSFHGKYKGLIGKCGNLKKSALMELIRLLRIFFDFLFISFDSYPLRKRIVIFQCGLLHWYNLTYIMYQTKLENNNLPPKGISKTILRPSFSLTRDNCDQ